MKRRSLATLALTTMLVLLTATAVGAAGANVTAQANPGLHTFEVTIRNLTDGQPLTPPLLAFHNNGDQLFTVGQPAGEPIMQIAENGNLGPAQAALDADPSVFNVTTAAVPLVPAGTPGAAMFPDEITLKVEVNRAARFLTYASMLICTNDGFTGVEGLMLPRQIGQTVTHTAGAYDAGTEINTEDFEDIVPPCQALIGVESDDEGTGMSDPALAEGGVVHAHLGIRGGEDLLPEVHGWTDPVVEISVTRVPTAKTFEVTIRNLTGGQPLTPPLLATHSNAVDLFTVGAPASMEIMQIAENGNLDPAIETLMSSSAVHDVVVGGVPLVPAGTPGAAMFPDEITLTIEMAGTAKFLSYASMLICTNDGFTGLDRVRLPRNVGDSMTYVSAAYDAGTEINTEDFEDIVPPCQALIGVESDDEGTGMSDPALAEGGVIHHHPGIMGGEDLLPEVHGWEDPVVEVTIVRID